MTSTALVVTTDQEQYREIFTRELANLIGCEPNKLPTTCTKQVACEYLCLTNHKTLDVWRCNGRHGIVMMKVGKYSRPATNWMIDLKLSSLSIAGAVA